MCERKAFLVFNPIPAKVETVEKSIFQRWFSSPPATPEPDQETTETLAQRGSADAQFSLGLRYANGDGAEPDYVLAEQWYLKAAAQNHALAQCNLGVMYVSGQGRPSDTAKGAVWLQKAADLGDASAQFRLGELNHRAVRVGVSPVGGEARIDAYKWYRLAANQGYRGAEMACDSVNLHMTREEVIEGVRRVAAFNATSSQPTQAPE